MSILANLVYKAYICLWLVMLRWWKSIAKRFDFRQSIWKKISNHGGEFAMLVILHCVCDIFCNHDNLSTVSTISPVSRFTWKQMTVSCLFFLSESHVDGYGWMLQKQIFSSFIIHNESHSYSYVPTAMYFFVYTFCYTSSNFKHIEVLKQVQSWSMVTVPALQLPDYILEVKAQCSLMIYIKSCASAYGTCLWQCSWKIN